MKNVKELRDDLISTYNQVKSGDIKISKAKQLANISGKIISSAKIQLEYNRISGDDNATIKFLESDE